MRLRHKAHGVVVNVDDATGRRLLGGPWEPADDKPADEPAPSGDGPTSGDVPTTEKPARRRPAKKVTEDAGSGNDHTS